MVDVEPDLSSCQNPTLGRSLGFNSGSAPIIYKALSKLPYSSETRFPHWVKAEKSNTLHSARLLLRLNEVRHYRAWCSLSAC